MQQNIIRHKKQPIIQLFFVSLLLYLLGRQSLQVENGQFERQYSRIYATVVLVLAIGLLLAVIIIGWKGLRSFLKREE